jgi:hypothetical protein
MKMVEATTLTIVAKAMPVVPSKAATGKIVQPATQSATANFDTCMTKFKKKIGHWSNDFEKMVGDLESCQNVCSPQVPSWIAFIRLDTS